MSAPTAVAGRGALGACPLCSDSLDGHPVVCSACAAAADGRGNTRLLFFAPAASRSERRRRIEALNEHFDARVPRSELRAASAGHRAVLRGPAPVVQAAAAVIDPQEGGAGALTVVGAATRIPRSFLLLVASGLGVGVAAGAMGAPLLLGLSPLMAALLCLGAFERVRRPISRLPGRPSGLPGGAENRAVSALAALEGGSPAHTRLSSLLRLARVLARTSDPGTHGAWRRDLGSVVDSGATLALEIQRLDDVVHTLVGDGSGGDAGSGPMRQADSRSDPARRDAVATARQTGDRIEAGLVSAENALARVQARLSDGVLEDSLIVETARELESSAARYADALAEVEALLARG